MNWILGFILKWIGGAQVERALEYLQRRTDNQTERDKIRSQVEIEAIRATVQHMQIEADLNKTKFQFPWFWLFATLFVLPFALWVWAVILDSVFHFDWWIADLPTPELKQMFKDITSWLFYVGSGVGVVKLLAK